MSNLYQLACKLIHFNPKSKPMFFNYLKSAFRHLKKYRFFTLINITGLAIGLAASILLFLYIRYELSYDKFHKDYVNIYRIVSHVKKPGGKTMDIPRTLSDISGAMKQELPEIKEACKIYDRKITLKREEELYPNVQFMYVDSSFFDIFYFETCKGNKISAINTPGEVIITRSLAEKYFGDEDPINKEISWGDQKYTVGAVLRNIPGNSHFQFDILTSFYTMNNVEQFFKNHGWDFFTYFRVKPNVSKQQWEPKLSQLIDRITRSKLQEIGSEDAFEISANAQSLSRIHLHSGYSFDIGPQGDIDSIYIFSFLAAFILIIAIVNFINLVTAHSEYRSREVGMRKVLGAHRFVLIRQYLMESFLVVLVSLIVSLILVQLMAEPVGSLLGSELNINWLDPYLIVGLIIFAVIIGLLSGSYPALYLSRFDPVRIFSGTGSRGTRSRILQIILVVVQFTIAIFLITSLVIFRGQINYLNNKDLGVSKESVLVVHDISGEIRESYQSLRSELQQNPSIQSVTASASYPGERRSVQNARKAEDPPSESILVHENQVQDHYVETYDIEIIKGRSFREDLATDSTGFIINQQAAKKLGLENPVGKEIYVFQQKGKVIGLMKDFHFRSFHHAIEPLVFTHYRPYFGQISIRMNMNNLSETIDYIRSTVKSFDKDYYFRYSFIDDVFADLYKQERQTNKMILYGSLLAILIAILGLFALSSFTVVKRNREIAIRKAMGASYNRVVRLLLADILKWVVFVNILAWPAAYYFMRDWLQNFAYRIDMEFWMFLAGGIIALAIAAATISMQTFNAAAINPAETLRDE
ncbi:MAG: ABC transporter permease [Bacteroidota bacterium]